MRLRIPGFQVRLIIIFLLLLLVPAGAFTVIIRTALDRSMKLMAKEQVESALNSGLEIVRRAVDSSEARCLETARKIASDPDIPDLLSTQDADEIESSVIRRICDQNEKLAINLIGAGGMVYGDASLPSESVEHLLSRLEEDTTAFSLLEGNWLRCVIPIFDGEQIKGFAVVSEEIDPKLIEVANDIGDALKVYSSLSMIRDDLQRMIWLMILVLIVVMIGLGVAVAILLSRSITRPIMKLVDGAKEIASGNLDHVVDAKARGEIGDLIDAFNTMAADLKEKQERLLRAERIAAWRDIARRIAHEIKNPLTPIQLSIFRLQRKLRTDDEEFARLFEECSTTIVNEIENLRDLANEFSEFARMPEPEFRKTDLNEVVEETIKIYESPPEGIKLETHIHPEPLPTELDEGQMKRVLHNLIKNGIEAMEAGGTLTISTGCEKNKVFVEVADTGVGISDELKTKIFTPYFTTKKTGTGLGMAVVGQIVEQHNGEISIQSEVGKGTRIRIYLRRAESDETDQHDGSPSADDSISGRRIG